MELLRSGTLFDAELRASLFAGLLSGCIWVEQSNPPSIDRTIRAIRCFSMSTLDQADNPRRLVPGYDDSDVSSIASPSATVLDRIPCWVQSYCLLFPLHRLEDQSRRWGRCFTLASGGRNCTCTKIKLSKTSRSSPLIPDFAVISRERFAVTHI